jgi:hypothetical protein
VKQRQNFQSPSYISAGVVKLNKSTNNKNHKRGNRIIAHLHLKEYYKKMIKTHKELRKQPGKCAMNHTIAPRLTIIYLFYEEKRNTSCQYEQCAMSPFLNINMLFHMWFY